ncbi:MAG: SPASM domain-containing protein [Sedimentisphaerales bacterium]|nr:SPASM domain-containing protein [Sedimentisphaerales bacterium]
MSETNGRKNVAVLYACPAGGVLGLRSRIAETIAGRPILRRTVERLQRAQRLSEIIVFCPAQDGDRIQVLLAGTRAHLIGLNQPPPVSRHVRRRKWSLHSWRGGIREATVFDEQPWTTEMIELLRRREVFTVVAVPAEAILVDPDLIDGLIDHHHEQGAAMRFTFSQAAPGLAGCAYRLDLLHELNQAQMGVGDLLMYDPESPHADYIMQECNYRVPRDLCVTGRRYIADTQRSFELLERLAAAGNGQLEGDPAERLMARLSEIPEIIDPLPRELEIEICTAPSNRIIGYPHRGDNGHPNHPARLARPDMPLSLFEKIVGDCGAYDDLCLTIGGFGEPLSRPDLPQVIELAKQAGIWAIHIETDGLGLEGRLAEALCESAADVISVYLDADSRQTYQSVKGADQFEQVTANIESYLEMAQARKGPAPLLIPHLVKSRQTIDEMEAFYDRWLRRGGAAVIEGYNDFAGQIEDRAVMDMCPPQRFACRRLDRTLTILSDGSAVICGQDFRGDRPIGHAGQTSINQLWQTQLKELRQAQRQGRFDANPLCARCKEWHR